MAKSSKKKAEELDVFNKDEKAESADLENKDNVTEQSEDDLVEAVARLAEKWNKMNKEETESDEDKEKSESSESDEDELKEEADEDKDADLKEETEEDKEKSENTDSDEDELKEEDEYKLDESDFEDLKEEDESCGDKEKSEETELDDKDKKSESYRPEDQPEPTSKTVPNKTNVPDNADIQLAKEAFDTLLGGKDLSEEFKAQTKLIFETALAASVKAHKARVVREAVKLSNKKIEEGIASNKKALSETVNNYATYVAEAWLDQNKLAVERGVMVESYKGFMKGLKQVFENNYVELPKGKHDLVENLTEDLRKSKNLLEQLTKVYKSTKEENASLSRTIAIKEAAEGLTGPASEKLAFLSEAVTFTSPEKFKADLKTLRERFIDVAPSKGALKEGATKVLTEETKPNSEATTDAGDNRRARYVDAIRSTKRH